MLEIFYLDRFLKGAIINASLGLFCRWFKVKFNPALLSNAVLFTRLWVRYEKASVVCRGFCVKQGLYWVFIEFV